MNIRLTKAQYSVSVFGDNVSQRNIFHLYGKHIVKLERINQHTSVIKE